MKATEILMEEHRVIERVLTAMETMTARVESGAPYRPGFFLDTADFIKGFADGCHHKKEEGVLFKAIVANMPPLQGGPVSVMLAEHEQARKYTRAMSDAAQKLIAGDSAAQVSMLEAARGYTVLLRQHIAKEDTVLFPMSERIIPPDQREQLVTDFEYIEHTETGAGVHEKYEGLAELLEREVGI